MYVYQSSVVLKWVWLSSHSVSYHQHKNSVWNPGKLFLIETVYFRVELLFGKGLALYYKLLCILHCCSSSTLLTKDSVATCPILERVLNSTPPGISQGLIRVYQTLVLQSIMEFLQTGGKEDIMVIFREEPLAFNLDKSFSGLGVFCSRLVDKVCIITVPCY